MKLTELNPSFLKITEGGHFRINGIKEADGIIFDCPKCLKTESHNDDHSIICWQPHIPQTVTPKPGRWNFVGTSFEYLSLVNSSSSVSITHGCKAHFFIKNGEIIMC